MRTFFAASSVSVGPKFAVASTLIFSQEEEAEVDCLRVVGGWLSTSVAMGVSRVVYLPFILYTLPSCIESITFAFDHHVVR